MQDQTSQRQPGRIRAIDTARAQLTLVEHALCPLDAGVSLQPLMQFETGYDFTDKNRNRRQAKIRIAALDGLSAHDELYLWGLLSISLTQTEPRNEFMATPYYCLRRLGLIGEHKGGREFELFRAAIKRLAGVRYQSDAFYDPIRGEHRAVSFGFLNYSLPLDADSSRAWRFAWDPIFFELAQATGGALSFDIGLYRELTPAARRLYLFLKKLFWRAESTPQLDLRHVGVNVLGFSDSLETNRMREKVGHCVAQLQAAQIVDLPLGVSDPVTMFSRQGKGRYTFELRRGALFNVAGQQQPALSDSPLVEPLLSIGFDEATVRRLLQTYSARLLEEWADITLAAKERQGDKFFSKSPMAYFVSNITEAAAGRRTPPDWWRELRKREREIERQQETSKLKLLHEQCQTSDFETYLETEVREEFLKTIDRVSTELRTAGQSTLEAREHAEEMARIHFQNRFRREHPAAQQREDGPVSLSQFFQES